VLTGGGTQQGLAVWVTCTGAREIRREAKTDAHGDFEVKDVGPLPCTIETFTSKDSVQIRGGPVAIKAYADHVTLTASVSTIQRPRH